MKMAKSSLFWFCAVQFFCSMLVISHAKPPNVVFILTDDQDLIMDSMEAMNKTRKLLGDAGVTFTNMFVTNPLCCPSRSSILTGRYTHNHQALNNSISGNCSSPAWQQTSEKEAFPTYLKQAGYKTFFAGKYLNQYGLSKAGGVEHIPPGWDEWIGLVGNSRYYNFTLSVNGKAEKHGQTYPGDYLTEIIGQRAIDYIDNNNWKDTPFFMMLSTPACHAPFTPAPQYNASFPGKKSPRNPNFGIHTTDKHWLINQATNPMSNDAITTIDEIFRNRWRTLLTVDDIVADLIARLQKKDLLKDTYIIYTGDNGYHLGQFNLPNDKRQLYEFDIRVPLLVRGPGIAANQTQHSIALNIDLAPTFLDIAGITPPNDMDGKSLLPLFNSSKTPAEWRTDFMVEHFGEADDSIAGCPQYDHQQMSTCEIDCTCEDSANNTYGCVRQITATANVIYCQFSDSVDFVEVYDIGKDPYQLKNAQDTMDPKVLVKLNTRLVQLAVCSGDTCRAQPGHYGFDSKNHLQDGSSVLSMVDSKEHSPLRFSSIEEPKPDVATDTRKGASFGNLTFTWRNLQWLVLQTARWFSNLGYVLL